MVTITCLRTKTIVFRISLVYVFSWHFYDITMRRLLSTPDNFQFVWNRSRPCSVPINDWYLESGMNTSLCFVLFVRKSCRRTGSIKSGDSPFPHFSFFADVFVIMRVVQSNRLASVPANNTQSRKKNVRANYCVEKKNEKMWTIIIEKEIA